MKLTFIGTSHGVPEHDRKCACYMMEIGGKYYFIDMGTQAMEVLRRKGVDIADVKLCACTHCHGDHTDGLINFVDLLSWYFKAGTTDILLPDEPLIDAMKAWLRATASNLPNGDFREGLNVSVYQAGVIFEDENLKLTAIATQHCPNSHAFLAEADGAKILFTGDLGHPTKDFPDVKDVPLDLVICECAHFSPFDAIPEFDKLNVKKVLHSHVSPRWHLDLEKAMQEPHPYEYGISFDGLELNF